MKIDEFLTLATVDEPRPAPIADCFGFNGVNLDDDTLVFDAFGDGTLWEVCCNGFALVGRQLWVKAAPSTDVDRAARWAKVMRRPGPTQHSMNLLVGEALAFLEAEGRTAKVTARCPACRGFGRYACDECRGTGVVTCDRGHEHDCDEPDCVGGHVACGCSTKDRKPAEGQRYVVMPPSGSTVEVRVGLALLDTALVGRVLATAPTAVVKVSSGTWSEAVRFEAEGWRGLVMPRSENTDGREPPKRISFPSRALVNEDGMVAP